MLLFCRKLNTSSKVFTLPRNTGKQIHPPDPSPFGLISNRNYPILPLPGGPSSEDQGCAGSQRGCLKPRDSPDLRGLRVKAPLVVPPALSPAEFKHLNEDPPSLRISIVSHKTLGEFCFNISAGQCFDTCLVCLLLLPSAMW